MYVLYVANAPLSSTSDEYMYLMIVEISDTEFNRNSDCFVTVISTHGLELKSDFGEQGKWEQYLLGSDCEEIKVTDILELFTDRNAECLRGKPKLFFFRYRKIFTILVFRSW